MSEEEKPLVNVELTANTKKSKTDIPHRSYASGGGKAPVPTDAKDRPKIERISETVSATRKKKSFGQRVKQTLTGEDARSVGEYLFYDVVVPAVKNLLSDAISQGTDRMLFGAGSTRSRPRTAMERTHTPYGRMSVSSSRPPSRELSHRERATHNFDNLIVTERADAEEAIDRLMALIEEYKFARVADLYEMLGISRNPEDTTWGWYSLPGAGTHQTRDGYLLILPQPEPLE